MMATMSFKSLQFKQIRKIRNFERKNLTSSLDAAKSLEIKNLVLSPAREKYSYKVSDNFEHQYLNMLYPEKALVKSKFTQTMKSKKRVIEPPTLERQ